MKILSLFDGMSVAQQALKELGYAPEYYASEIDEYAITVTQSNHPNTTQLGSVLGVSRVSNFNLMEAIKFNGIDLLIGGSPCQDLSIAKKDRKGLDGERSGLFYEYVRIRDEVKPKCFILENVASMSKESKDKISEVLGVQPVMINASLVSAQNRKRLFWVGKLDEFGTYKQVEITQPEDKGILLRDILETDVDEKYYVNVSEKYGAKGLCEETEKSKAMTATMWKGYGNDVVTTVRVGSLNSGGQGDRIYSQDGKSVALSALGGGRGAKTGLYVTKIGNSQKFGNPKREADKSYTLTAGRLSVGIEENMQIRKLTPTECLRLQSMPDDYFDKATYKGKPISNTQRYKMCGNAFNCEVVKHIIKQLNLK